jgi:riboflavin kinase/FMN adenylyltransferase
MKLIRGINTFENKQGCVATIGNFDGLHLGHQTILNRLRAKANELALPLTVISFEPLPAEYFMPEPPARIYPMRDKIRLLNELGVDNYFCLKFDDALANMPPEVFVRDILLDKLAVKYLAVGDDFRFGYKRAGDFKLLKKIGAGAGMEVTDTPTCEKDGKRVSSTRIRHLLEKGDIQSANQLLGHKYQLSGRIRHGDKRGRTIGFPTLNMRVLNHIAPARGVYVVQVHGLSNQPLGGVANLGARPTVKGTENRLETHLFDFNENVYGRYICVELLEFLRAEQRFDDFEKLKIQIMKDAEQARNLLTGFQ